MQLNDNFYCPITYGIMIDPVIGIDGHTYEKSAIESWLNKSNKSPLTKQHMTVHDLVPNIALRNTIESYLISNPEMVKSIKPKPSELSSEMKRNILITSSVFNKNKLYVKLQANDEPIRKATTCFFVIDTSGSMNAIETNNGTSESNIFTRLDLVKHSVRTVIEVLNDNDSICLITFSNDAKVVLDITKMTENGKEKALLVLDKINADGMTNIWDGLRISLLNIEKITDPNVNISVLVLTDGEPNINPPRGIIPTLQSAIESRKINQSFTLNTFGYGYDVDSKLLVDIANCGSGSYGYIPDSSMVGTIFVNYLSNVLSTYLSNSKLDFSCNDPNVSIVPEMYYTTYNKNVGSILFDQPRELLYDIIGITQPIKLHIDLIVAKQVINSIDIDIDNTLLASCAKHDCNTDIIEDINYNNMYLPNIIRYKIMNSINHNLNYIETHNVSILSKEIKQLYDEIIELKNNKPISQPELDKINGYIADYINPDNTNIGGQIEKAFSRLIWYNKWGKHFLHSIMNAYYNQQCNNFKDPGVQLFAGNLFNQIRIIADNAFCMLPAPKPTLLLRHQYSRSSSNNMRGGSSNMRGGSNNMRGGSNNTQIAPTNMSSYYNKDGGCFSGDSQIIKVDSTNNEYSVLVSTIKKGDIVKTIDKNNLLAHTTVKCVVKSLVPSGTISMCNINNMLITPWHPIIFNNKWVFPIDIAPEENIKLDCVYNIVLESNHIVWINYTPVVTLGHNFINDIVAHPYYGSQKIIQDLSQMDGWDNGFITISQPTIERTNGLVSKLINS
jgi:Mg-chelatase subunit ChlD